MELDLVNNPYCIGFNNGVYCLCCDQFWFGATGLDSDPHLSVGYNFDYDVDPDLIKEINEYMTSLWPKAEEREAMWDFLASCLEGGNSDGKLYAWLGTGANGKTVLLELLKQVFGDYLVYGPSDMLTQERPPKDLFGRPTTRLQETHTNLLGTRLLIINEPGINLNSRLVKDLVTMKPIEYRPLYGTTMTYTPMFKAITAINQPFMIKVDDYGLQKRIQYREFPSTFVHRPNGSENQFKANHSLTDRFPKWRMAFMSLLLNRYKANM